MPGGGQWGALRSCQTTKALGCGSDVFQGARGAQGPSLWGATIEPLPSSLHISQTHLGLAQSSWKSGPSSTHTPRTTQLMAELGYELRFSWSWSGGAQFTPQLLGCQPAALPEEGKAQPWAHLPSSSLHHREPRQVHTSHILPCTEVLEPAALGAGDQAQAWMPTRMPAFLRLPRGLKLVNPVPPILSCKMGT